MTICAQCVHAHRQQGLWLCRASIMCNVPDKVNLVTGDTVEGYTSYFSCSAVNDGNCKLFTPKPPKVEVPYVPPPRRSWWHRLSAALKRRMESQ